jgi:hypothetical protein
MSIAAGWRPRVIAALLVVAAVLFVIGVTAESDEDTHRDEPSAQGEEHSEAGESAEVRADEAAAADEEAETTEGTEGDEERVLGLDLESPGPVAAAVVLSVVLAALVLWRRDRRVLVVTAVVAGAFAVLDIVEVSHQLDEDNAGLAVLAATIAVLHAATAALAVWHTIDNPPTTDALEGVSEPASGGSAQRAE